MEQNILTDLQNNPQMVSILNKCRDNPALIKKYESFIKTMFKTDVDIKALLELQDLATDPHPETIHKRLRVLDEVR